MADSLYNLQVIREFCDSCLKSSCHLALEDMLYIPQELEVKCVFSIDGLLLTLGIISSVMLYCPLFALFRSTSSTSWQNSSAGLK